MRRIIPLSVLALLIATAGSAMADRRDDRRNNNRSNYSQRDHRHYSHRDHRPHYTRDYRSNYTRRDYRPNYSQWNWNNGRRDYVRGHHRPIYVNNGHYHFHNGRSIRYSRPYIGVRYTNYRVRPVVLVENYETMPGYIWVPGSWQWNGYEWSWISGHYQVDTAYADDTGYSTY